MTFSNIFYRCFYSSPYNSQDYGYNIKEVQVGKDQEKAQSVKDSHSKNRGGKKTKPIIRHHENIS